MHPRQSRQETAAKRFPPASRTILFDAVLTHDVIALDAVMPAYLPIPSTQALEAAFWLSHDVWQDGFSHQILAGVAERTARSGRLTTRDASAVKHIRARCKQLRFLFLLADKRHRAPKRLDRITRALGTMQDAAKHDRSLRVIRTACYLRLLSSNWGHTLLSRECADLRPASQASFSASMDHQYEGLQSILGRPEIGIREFHEARKVVSRLVALFDTQRTLAPSPIVDSVSRSLNTLNGLMGDLHDEFVARKQVRRDDYMAGFMVIPEDIASRLYDLAQAMALRLRQDLDAPDHDASFRMINSLVSPIDVADYRSTRR